MHVDGTTGEWRDSRTADIRSKSFYVGYCRLYRGCIPSCIVYACLAAVMREVGRGLQ